MATNFYPRKSLIGGGAGALDEIDGAGLNDLDFAIVSILGKIYMYSLDDDSAAAESSPDVISPDANAGDKRWILQGIAMPTGGSAGAPAISFGDGNSGIYEQTDNNVGIVASGGLKLRITANALEIAGSTSRAGIVVNAIASAIKPVFLPNGTADDDTGVGGNSLRDIVNLIAGGMEGLRITEAGGNINIDFKGDLNLISYEEETVYFEGSAVLNY